LGRTGKAKGGRKFEGESNLPVFLTANNLNDFINSELTGNSTPIPFKDLKRIKAGLTILLNTATNTTFIASAMDEQVQTGTRDNDGHIEWAGELSVPVLTLDMITDPTIIVKEDELRNYAKWKDTEFRDAVCRQFNAGDFERSENHFINMYMNK
jgi:hypothetical protein